MNLFSNVDAFREDSGVDELSTGLVTQPSQRSDNNIVEDVRFNPSETIPESHHEIFNRSQITSLTVNFLGRTSSPLTYSDQGTMDSRVMLNTERSARLTGEKQRLSRYILARNVFPFDRERLIIILTPGSKFLA